MRWTEKQLADHLARTGVPGRPLPRPDVSAPPFKPAPNKAGMYALGRLKTGEKNKTEDAYGKHLEQRQHARDILWFAFEPVKLRLADNTFYTPDYGVIAADGVLELHEVKGFWQDDARVKIKVAADKYPFRFIAVKPIAKKNGGGWAEEKF